MDCKTIVTFIVEAKIKKQFLKKREEGSLEMECTRNSNNKQIIQDVLLKKWIFDETAMES